MRTLRKRYLARKNAPPVVHPNRTSHPDYRWPEEGDLTASAMKALSWRRKISFALLASSLTVAVIYIALLRGILQEHRTFSSSLLSVDRMEQALHRMEGANNGFLLTGNDAFRMPFREQRDILSGNYYELLTLTADDAVQQDRLKKFKSKLTQWFALYNPLIIRRRSTPDTASAQTPIPSMQKEKLRQCKLLFEEMLFLLGEIRSTQQYKSAPQGDSAVI